MRKSFIVLAALMATSVCSAQTLDEIVNKYYAANGIENLEKANTIYVEGTVSQMGNEMPITITVKKPNKVKVVISFSGMDIITAFDGEKGYMVNPMTGATEPVEIPEEQLSSVQEYNMFRDNMLEAYKAGRLKLEGEEEVDGKPCYKVLITDETGNTTTAYIDKDTMLTFKAVSTVEQMGQKMTVESYIKEYMDVNGAKFAKVITQNVNGMELSGITFNKVEFDREIDDSIFAINE
jgi:outer membrane lipoprotein-sorting protein